MIQGLFPDEIVERIHPDTRVIGIACMFSSLWPLTRDLAARLRQRFPEALMVLGGEHGTAVPEHVLTTSSPFDVVVLGEGEETVGRAAPRPPRGPAVPRGAAASPSATGTAWSPPGSPPPEARRRRDPAARLGLVPDRGLHRAAPDQRAQHGALDAAPGHARLPVPVHVLLEPRHVDPALDPARSQAVVDEMELYVRKYRRVTNFDFQDLTAIVKRQWIVDFCRELIARDLDITWQMPSGTRAEVFDDEVADLLYRSGCRALAFAPGERLAGDPQALIKKQVDLGHMLEAMRTIVRQGLKLSCFIVIGFPDDTPATLRQTLRLIRRMAVLGVDEIAISKFVPYPGSLLFRQLLAAGKIELTDEFFVSPMDIFSSKAPSYAERLSSAPAVLDHDVDVPELLRDLVPVPPAPPAPHPRQGRLHRARGDALREVVRGPLLHPPALAEDRLRRLAPGLGCFPPSSRSSRSRSPRSCT